MIGENRPMTFSYHIDYKLGSTVKTATGSNEDLLLQCGRATTACK